jgi:hypothetical protein
VYVLIGMALLSTLYFMACPRDGAIWKSEEDGLRDWRRRRGKLKV